MTAAESVREGVIVSSGEANDLQAVAVDSRTLAFWILVSRITGFGRIAALGAVLGPTFFGNLFQTVLLTPYLICEFLAGSLITAMLAPRLVHLLDRGERSEVERLASGFLSCVLLAFAAVTAVGIVAAPAIVWLLTLAVADDTIRVQQIALGWPLLTTLLPQIVLYGLIGVSIAVQHAHRKFALATAAPIAENLGMIAVFVTYGMTFGFGLDVHEVGLPQLLLLGLGSTAAVGLHAAVQLWGVRRLGVRLYPTAGWRDTGVRQIIRLALPSGGTASLSSLSHLAMIIASGQVPGGAIAFQIGVSLFNLPVALGARPISSAQLPLLSRHSSRANRVGFEVTYLQSLRLVLFLALPATLLFLSAPAIFAAGISFGEMGDPAAMMLVAAVIAGISVGVVGESAYVVSITAAYTRFDVASPFQATLIRLSICLGGIPLALLASTAIDQLRYLALVYSAASLAAAAFLIARVVGRVSLGSSRRLLKWLFVNTGVAILAVAPVTMIARNLDIEMASFAHRFLIAAALMMLGVFIYLALQAIRQSSELAILLGSSGPTPPHFAQDAE